MSRSTERGGERRSGGGKRRRIKDKDRVKKQ